MFARFIFSMLFLCTTLTGAWAQHPSDAINMKNLNGKFLAELIIEKCNHLRDSIKLTKLKKDSVLTQAAKNQAIFNAKAAHPDHYQPTPVFSTPEKRVEYFKGTHERVGEITDVINVNQPVRINKQNTLMKVITYEDAARFYILNTILNTTAGWENISNKQFYTSGIEFGVNLEQNSIYVVQVLGSQPFNFHHHTRHKDNKTIFYPSKKANIENAYGLQPYDQTICYKCISAYTTVPDYIEKGLVIEGNQICFKFTDLETFNKVFLDGDEAIAVDIVHKEQFPCSSDNVAHRSFAHDGVLYKPLTKAEILKANIAKNKTEILAPLGPLPPDFSPEEYECNLLLIKSNIVCRVFKPVPIVESKITLMNNEYFTDTTEQSSILKKKNLRFNIAFERGKVDYQEKDIRPIYDSLQLNKFNIKEIVIFAYSSIEGSTENNAELQQKRAESIVKVLQSFQLDTIKTVIKTFENWDQFYREIKNTSFAYLANMEKEAVKQKLATNDSLRNALEPYFKRQRKALLFLKIEEKLDLASNHNELPKHFKNALAKKDYVNATIIQRAIFNSIEDTLLTYAAIDSVAIPEKKEYIQILNNDLLFRYNHNIPANYIKEMEKISALDPGNVFFKFNLYEMMLRQWSDSSAYLSGPDGLIRNIKTLYNTKVDKKLVTRLYLNAYILGTAVYQNQKKYKQRDDAVGLVKKYYKTIDLNTNDILALANYFEVYNREAWALEILYTYIQSTEEVNEEILFYFLSIAISNSELFDKNELVILYLQKAKDLNPSRFCKLYGSPTLNFQLLKDEGMKKLYCENCQDMIE